MFEGENEIVLSKETAKKLFSQFLSNLFHSPITVTSMESDYKGLTLEFTVNTEAREAAKEVVEPSKESEVEAE